MQSITVVFAALIAGASCLFAQGSGAVWATDSAVPCAGLTVGWHVAAGTLQALIGSRGTVAADSTGRGVVILFATTCSGTTIDGRPTGPVALGAAIVRLAPQTDTTLAPGTRWSAVPAAFGPAGAPVTGLVQRSGFDVGTGPVSLHADSSAGARRVTFVIATAKGRIEATALIGDSVSHFALTGALLATGTRHPGRFAGQEWATRRGGTATVRATGETLLSQLAITAPPDIVAYDTGFGWRFTFSADR